MGKKSGYNPETPVFLGTTNVNLARKQRAWRLALFIVTFCIDIVASLMLFTIVHLWSDKSDFPIWSSLKDFYRDTSDLIVLCVIRILCLAGLAHVGSLLAMSEAVAKEELKFKPKPKRDDHLKGLVQVNGKVRNGEAIGSIREPLLTKTEPKLEVKSITAYEEWFSGSSKKDIVLFATFLICTAFQAYVGAKCVSFYFDVEHSLFNVRVEVLQSVLMSTTVVWINAESSLLSRVVDANRVLARAMFLNSKRSRPDSHDSRVSVITNSVNLANGDPTEEGTLKGDKGLKNETEIDQNSYLLRAIRLAKNEACLLACALLCLGLSSLSSLILPSYQGRILDHVIQRDVSLFKRDVLLLIAFSLMTGLFEAVRNLCFAVVGKRVLKTLQDKLFMGIVIQDIAYFDGTTSGELTSRLTNDVSSMAEPVNWMLSALLRNCLSLVGGFTMCFMISWKLSMLAFTTMAPIMHITAVYSRWSRELNRKRYALLAEANSAASEAIGNIRTVRAFSTEDTELDRFKSKTYGAMQKGVRDAYAYAGAVAVNDWLDLGASVLILWYGGVLVMNDRLSAGKLITFQLYWNQIQSAYQSIMSVLMSLTRAAGAAQRVLSLVDALPDIDRNSGTQISKLDGEIKLENLYFCYQMRPQHPVLQGVDLTVGKGDVCALVGRSGGGKSTIVHLLMRFYDPTAGRILLDGWDLRDLNLKSVHQHMGLVAQETQMFACSILENITYGLSSWRQEDLEEAAKYANAHDFIMKFPEGYATRVGERGVRLSGGQRQRIAIARMLLRRPKVLLLDEATSSLDTESEALVQQALDRLIGEGGRTIVLVAHRLSTVRNADNIAVLDKGRLVEQGTHEELLMQSMSLI
ncbi:ABC transporter B family member 25 isoform X2 [Physcomitrium patens]|uniref:ABC transporter B family member 25 isoform X2 n=1 Tax=Physcomitrium patens TaxID=3218 RepID=UPI00024AF1F8|nr:ABC transporter B family member 25-like isoform X2 [Physcomitrium patens]|eukprot:XP_024363403.1 ABC transporter B family member 25-like isoform X2 [Physcomitrella patens]